MSSNHPIPPAFAARKSAILTSLSAPPQSYTDLSPKGTVDTAIIDLIARINAIKGIVTTSSCAGRVSVFLEGRKGAEEEKARSGRKDVAVPGGKGMGGRWCFVSHEPLKMLENSDSVTRMLGLEPMRDGQPAVVDKEPNEIRLARFQFEPMILHIMAASLHHAQPILAAAINAGFRESGVQNLKNLDDANSFPMIAIRSSGLALESVVGACVDGKEEDAEEVVNSIVREEYLELLVKLANERFKTNTLRMKRFEIGALGKEPKGNFIWEDSEARKARKRTEGLDKRRNLRREAPERHNHSTVDSDVDGNHVSDSELELGSLSIS